MEDHLYLGKYSTKILKILFKSSGPTTSLYIPVKDVEDVIYFYFMISYYILSIILLFQQIDPVK